MDDEAFAGTKHVHRRLASQMTSSKKASTPPRLAGILELELCLPNPSNSKGFPMPLHPWHAVRFQLIFRTAHGNAFQDFIGDVLERRFREDFFRIKPAGRQGDKKCDGIIQSRRILLQVYAPEQMRSQPAIDKIDEDLAGAAENWGLLFDQWIFLHNQFKGLSPDIAAHLISIEGQFGKKIRQWSESHVQELVEELKESDLLQVLGPMPDFRHLAPVTMSDISTVVLAVAQQNPSSESFAPVPSDKLDANGLSGNVKELLRAGTQKSRNVRDLFEKWHDPELGDRVAAAFRKKYDEVKATSMAPDEIFRELWAFAGGGRYLDAAKECATLSLLAFLFEQCDIFEAHRSAGQ
jgi:hypothetical protein